MRNQKLNQLKNETDTHKPAAGIFFFLLPILFMLFFFLIIQKNPMDFHLVFSDELDYWAETATLIKRGLFNPNAGYFGYSFGSYARFLYFGAHGFFSLIPNAVFSIFAPLNQVAVLLVNALFTGISLSTSYYLLGSFRKTLVIALTLFAFYPFYLYFQTGMLETLFYGGSIIMAVLCVKSFAPDSRQQSFLNYYFWIVILFSLFRLSNLVLLIPAFFVEIGLLKRKTLTVLIKYGAISVVVALASIVFAATYPWGFLGELGKSTDKLGMLLAHTASNIKLLFDIKAGYALEILPRFLFLFWLIFLCVVYFATKKHNPKESNLHLLSIILAMLALLFINITFYDIGSFRDLRVLSPVLVFSMIACFLFPTDKRFKNLVFGLTAVFLLASNSVVAIERGLVWDLFISGRDEATTPAAILKDVRYDPEAKTRWENTAYVDLDAYGGMDWQNYDPGIGLMVMQSTELTNFDAANSTSLLQAKYIITYVKLEIPGYELKTNISNLKLYGKADK